MKGIYYFDDIRIEEISEIDENDLWYHQADQRIDEMRKGTFSLQFENDQGEAVSVPAIDCRLIQHDFLFGSAVNFDSTELLTEDEWTWYEDIISTKFNTITTENALKWVDYEPTPNDIDTLTLRRYTDFAEEHDLYLRGHVLEWGLENYGFDTHWSRKGDMSFLLESIKERITRDVSYYRGKIHEYDVWNEPFHEMSLFIRGMEDAGSPLPQDNIWALMDSAFIWAREADSTVPLFVNEYSVIAGGQTDTYYELVRGMQERGIPVDGIGVQCHFGQNKIVPELIRHRFDRLAELGLAIRITEFDMGTKSEGLLLSEYEQASEYARFVRTAFSHPAVDGILLWGFWDKNHWIGAQGWSGQGAGLFRADRSRKPAADSVFNLWEKEWTTHETLQGNVDNYAFNGFYGRYEVRFLDDEGQALPESSFEVQFSKNSLHDTIVISDDVASLLPDQIKSQKPVLISLVGNNGIRIEGLHNSGKRAKVTVCTVAGRIISEQFISVHCSANIVLPHIAAGVHLIHIDNGSEQIRKKLLFYR